jgi:hypothetical protein
MPWYYVLASINTKMDTRSWQGIETCKKYSVTKIIQYTVYISYKTTFFSKHYSKVNSSSILM